jgi:hypothetical protein
LTQKLGGVRQIMQEHVDQVLRALPAVGQALCADLFRYLVTPGGAKIAYPAADLARQRQRRPQGGGRRHPGGYDRRGRGSAAQIDTNQDPSVEAGQG